MAEGGEKADPYFTIEQAIQIFFLFYSFSVSLNFSTNCFGGNAMQQLSAKWKKKMEKAKKKCVSKRGRIVKGRPSFMLLFFLENGSPCGQKNIGSLHAYQIFCPIKFDLYWKFRTLDFFFLLDWRIFALLFLWIFAIECTYSLSNIRHYKSSMKIIDQYYIPQ